MIPDTYDPTANVVHELVLTASCFCSSQYPLQIVNKESEWAIVVLGKTIFSDSEKIMNGLIETIFMVRHMEIAVMTATANSAATINRD